MKEHFEDIIKSLTQATISGSLEWVCEKYGTSSMKIITNGDDGTLFSLFVSWSFKENGWEKNDYNLEVKNKNYSLNISLYSFNYPDVEKLGNLLYNKYCPDFKFSKSESEDTINNIKRGISISSFRDSKINKIFEK